MTNLVKFDFSDIDKKKHLIKSMYMKEASDDELELFLRTAEKLQLDPILKQIYAVPRKNKAGVTTYTHQTGIDGYRIIADRTGKYCPGRSPTFEYNDKKELVTATAYVKKLTSDGMWHEVSATVFYDEYVVGYFDKQKNTWHPNEFWKDKPHVMLAKCAESLAIRKCFPAELSGVYTTEEMPEAEVHDITTPKEPKPSNAAKKEEVLSLDAPKVAGHDEYTVLHDYCVEHYTDTGLGFFLDHQVKKMGIPLANVISTALRRKDLFLKAFKDWALEQEMTVKVDKDTGEVVPF